MTNHPPAWNTSTSGSPHQNVASSPRHESRRELLSFIHEFRKWGKQQQRVSIKAARATASIMLQTSSAIIDTSVATFEQLLLAAIKTLHTHARARVAVSLAFFFHSLVNYFIQDRVGVDTTSFFKSMIIITDFHRRDAPTSLRHRRHFRLENGRRRRGKGRSRVTDISRSATTSECAPFEDYRKRRRV